MKLKPLFAASVALFALAGGTVFAEDASTPFNGKDLSGWKTKKKAKGKDAWVVGAPSQSAANPKTLDVADAASGAAMVNKVSGHGQSWLFFKQGDRLHLKEEVIAGHGT